MHQIIITIHVWTSILFVIVAIALCISSVNGLIKHKEFSKFILYQENLFIGLLYLGLFLGVILYFFIPGDNKLTQDSYELAFKHMNARFWSIEHFSVMLFAMMFAQIGKIFTLKAISSKEKFKYALFYYGTTTIIAFISTAFYLYYKL